MTDPEVLAELRRRGEGDEREQFALAALRIGVLALRSASGQVDAATIREAGTALVSEVRDVLSARVTEMTERSASTLTQYLDPQSGALPAAPPRRSCGKTASSSACFRAHVGADDSLLARSLAVAPGRGQPPLQAAVADGRGGPPRAAHRSTVEEALADQRKHILREFSLDQKDSALSRLVAEFSLDGEGSSMSRLVEDARATSEQIGKNLTLDDEGSALSRLKRELEDMVEQPRARQRRVPVADARGDGAARHAQEGRGAHRRATGSSSRSASARSWPRRRSASATSTRRRATRRATSRTARWATTSSSSAPIRPRRTRASCGRPRRSRRTSLRAALEEIDEARRNRQAQVGVFVFSRKTAPEGLESLHRHGSDVMVVWDADDAASDVVVRAAYSLARCLAVRERRTDRESQAAILEIERAARGIEKQVGYLEEVRKWAETVKGHGEKIADRSSRMVEELRRDVERLDMQIAAMRTAEAPA